MWKIERRKITKINISHLKKKKTQSKGNKEIYKKFHIFYHQHKMINKYADVE